MTSIGLATAKAKLSSLIRRVEAGEEILITMHDRPVAALVPASRVLKPDADRYLPLAPVVPAQVREFSGLTYDSADAKSNKMNDKTTNILKTLKPEERIQLLEAALAERDAAHNLIEMMGSDPDVLDVPRRR